MSFFSTTRRTSSDYITLSRLWAAATKCCRRKSCLHSESSPWGIKKSGSQKAVRFNPLNRLTVRCCPLAQANIKFAKKRLRNLRRGCPQLCGGRIRLRSSGRFKSRLQFKPSRRQRRDCAFCLNIARPTTFKIGLALLFQRAARRTLCSLAARATSCTF